MPTEEKQLTEEQRDEIAKEVAAKVLGRDIVSLESVLDLLELEEINRKLGEKGYMISSDTARVHIRNVRDLSNSIVKL